MHVDSLSYSRDLAPLRIRPMGCLFSLLQLGPNMMLSSLTKVHMFHSLSTLLLDIYLLYDSLDLGLIEMYLIVVLAS